MRSNSNLQVSQSAGSSSNASANVRGRVVGNPPPCWCGHSVVELKSKSTRNPGRMYNRCSYAADNRLTNDGHYFKWADEVSGNLKSKTIEEELLEMKQSLSESIEFERKKLQQMEIEVEERLTERIELEISDAKRGFWKVQCIGVIIGLVIMFGFAKLRRNDKDNTTL